MIKNNDFQAPYISNQMPEVSTYIFMSLNSLLISFTHGNMSMIMRIYEQG